MNPSDLRTGMTQKRVHACSMALNRFNATIHRECVDLAFVSDEQIQPPHNILIYIKLPNFPRYSTFITALICLRMRIVGIIVAE